MCGPLSDIKYFSPNISRTLFPEHNRQKPTYSGNEYTGLTSLMCSQRAIMQRGPTIHRGFGYSTSFSFLVYPLLFAPRPPKFHTFQDGRLARVVLVTPVSSRDDATSLDSTVHFCKLLSSRRALSTQSGL